MHVVYRSHVFEENIPVTLHSPAWASSVSSTSCQRPLSGLTYAQGAHQNGWLPPELYAEKRVTKWNKVQIVPIIPIKPQNAEYVRLGSFAHGILGLPLVQLLGCSPTDNNKQ